MAPSRPTERTHSVRTPKGVAKRTVRQSPLTKLLQAVIRASPLGCVSTCEAVRALVKGGALRRDPTLTVERLRRRVSDAFGRGPLFYPTPKTYNHGIRRRFSFLDDLNPPLAKPPQDDVSRLYRMAEDLMEEAASSVHSPPTSPSAPQDQRTMARLSPPSQPPPPPPAPVTPPRYLPQWVEAAPFLHTSTPVSHGAPPASPSTPLHYYLLDPASGIVTVVPPYAEPLPLASPASPSAAAAAGAGEGRRPWLCPASLAAPLPCLSPSDVEELLSSTDDSSSSDSDQSCWFY